MKLLLDTHILLWTVYDPERLSDTGRNLIGSEDNDLVFSVASLWEIAIKIGSRRTGFDIDPRALRRALLDDGHEELMITGEHALATSGLPPIHNDPFDRLLIAQAMMEGIMLVTADRKVSEYPGPIRRV
jgi:PIN domain nuclease of toxin-antitoxin system